MSVSKGSDSPAPVRAHASFITARDVQAWVALNTGLARHLFIHIPKNAGVSLKKAPELRWKMVSVHRAFLKDRAYLDGLLEMMGAEQQHHGIGHARLRDVKPSIVRRLRPFAILRNPWARTVSRYRFAEQAVQQGKPFKVGPVDSFEAFLETRHQDGALPYFWHRAIRGWYPQRDYVVDDSGKIAADLLRQEHLDKDVTDYFHIKTPPRRRNVTRSEGKADWRSYYTDKTIQIVGDWYEDDIDTFGYDFDSSATRNIWNAEN
ncbi:MAG: hypothetical protein ACU0BB_16625 [Paracoccaceae bacterium]